VYLGDDGVPVLRVKDKLSRAESRAAILSRISRSSSAFPAVTASRLESAPFSFLELHEYRKLVRERIRDEAIPITNGIDVASSQLVLRVSAALSSRARAFVEELQIPSAAVRFEIAEPAVPGVSLRGVVRPVTGGVQISSISSTSDYCSVGLQAYKKDVNGYPDPSLGRFVSTANHCAPPVGIVSGLTFGQPHRGYGLHATEVANAELFTDARCPYGALKCQYADVALLQMVDSVASTWQRVATSNTANPPTFLGQLSLNTSVWSAIPGQPVRRVGATSGERDGTVASACVDLYQSGNGYILCSVEVIGHSDGGDSGGPVYTPLLAGYHGSPWPSGIYHSYLFPSKTRYWFSSISSVSFSLNDEYVFVY
jgi:hypothetical protein